MIGIVYDDNGTKKIKPLAGSDINIEQLGSYYESATVYINHPLWANDVYTFATPVPPGKYLLGGKVEFSNSNGNAQLYSNGLMAINGDTSKRDDIYSGSNPPIRTSYSARSNISFPLKPIITSVPITSITLNDAYYANDYAGNLVLTLTKIGNI